jgi:hypothetical protein
VLTTSLTAAERQVYSPGYHRNNVSIGQKLASVGHSLISTAQPIEIIMETAEYLEQLAAQLRTQAYVEHGTLEVP